MSDLKVVKTVNHTKARVGELLTYTMVVTNLGPDADPDAIARDTSTKPLEIKSIKTTQGTCTSGVPFTCDLGPLANGKSATITVTAPAPNKGTEDNYVTVTSSCKTAGCVPPTDPTPHNNISHARTAVVPATPAPKLKLTKTVSPAVLKAGQQATYHLKVTDTSSTAAQHVVVCDPVPSRLIVDKTSPNARMKSGKYCWTISKLKGQRSKKFAITTTATPGPAGRFPNTATASAKGVKTIRARATVRIIATPTIPCAAASAVNVRGRPTAHIAC
jgi:uncharacterized repeat protein (TIGR01451 family)